MNLIQEHFYVPEITYGCKITMSSTEFARICHDLSQFDEVIVFKCNNEGRINPLYLPYDSTTHKSLIFIIGLTFTVDSDIGVASVKLSGASNSSSADMKERNAVIIEKQESIRMAFSSRYLNLFTNATPLSKTVELSMSSGLPLAIEYKIENFGHIRYYLLEKILENDEK